jgi:hypothetical protein
MFNVARILILYDDDYVNGENTNRFLTAAQELQAAVLQRRPDLAVTLEPVLNFAVREPARVVSEAGTAVLHIGHGRHDKPSGRAMACCCVHVRKTPSGLHVLPQQQQHVQSVAPDTLVVLRERSLDSIVGKQALLLSDTFVVASAVRRAEYFNRVSSVDEFGERWLGPGGAKPVIAAPAPVRNGKAVVLQAWMPEDAADACLLTATFVQMLVAAESDVAVGAALQHVAPDVAAEDGLNAEVWNVSARVVV